MEYCKKCGGDMKEGSVLAPVYGNYKNVPGNCSGIYNGDTIYPVSAALTSGMKCVECGHTYIKKDENILATEV